MPTNSWVLLQKIKLSEKARTISFANLPQSGYTELKFMISARTDSSAINYDPFGVRFNNSVQTNSYRGLGGTGTNWTAYGVAGPDTFSITSVDFMRLTNTGLQSGGNGAGVWSSTEFTIKDYLSTNYKPFFCETSTEKNVSEAYQDFNSGQIALTSALTSVTMGCRDGSFVAGSTFSLYGLARYGTTPLSAPKATGGDIVANDGTYWYHAFVSSGRLIPLTDLTSCEVLQIGAGGGGSGNFGGGGGAGGIVYNSGVSLTSGTIYTALAAAGGADTRNGSASSFAGGSLNLTQAQGGGAGGGGTASGSATAQSQQNGGCGGGGGGNNGSVNQNTNAGGTGAQGSNGGTGKYDRYGGGGGGMGGAGANAAGSAAGNGGAGVNTYSAWASATVTGASGYYCGGGGGGSYNSSAGTGTNGGGNGGVVGNDGTAATARTGSGGGGGGGNNSGGNGAGGLVIVRYLMA